MISKIIFWCKYLNITFWLILMFYLFYCFHLSSVYEFPLKVQELLMDLVNVNVILTLLLEILYLKNKKMKTYFIISLLYGAILTILLVIHGIIYGFNSKLSEGLEVACWINCVNVLFAIVLSITLKIFKK